IDPGPKAGSPPIVIPTAPSVPSCSKLSRYGLARAKHIERLVRRPTLTAPRARRPWPCCGSGRRNGLSDRTKKLTKEDMRCTAELLDKRSPIQGPWCRFRREARARERHRHCSGGLPLAIDALLVRPSVGVRSGAGDNIVQSRS